MAVEKPLKLSVLIIFAVLASGSTEKSVGFMLFAAGHTKNDIPAVLKKYSNQTGLQIDFGKELGINNLMIGAAGESI